MKSVIKKLNWGISAVKKRFNNLPSTAKKTIATIGWVFGLCVAGADGPVFMNFLGVATFFLSTSVLAKEITE